MSDEKQPDPRVLANAVDDREAHPWRYYRFEREELTRFLNKQADEIAALQAQQQSASTLSDLALIEACDSRFGSLTLYGQGSVHLIFQQLKSYLEEGTAAMAEPMAQKLCLMSIRSWVDEAVAMHRRENGIATPNGLAGQIAAQVWLHVGDVLAHEAPALCHCGCSRPAHTFWREGGIFTGCKICACEAYEPLPGSPSGAPVTEPDFDQIARQLKAFIDDHPQLIEQNVRAMAEALRQVWNARGYADANAIADRYTALTGWGTSEPYRNQMRDAIKALDL